MTQQRSAHRAVALALLAAGLVLGGAGLWGLSRARSGVEVAQRLWPTPHGPMPVAVYTPGGSGAADAPAVIVIHGFAGSKELMRPFGVYLAQSGRRAYLVDVTGHGHNPAPLQRTGAPDDIEAMINDLIASGEAQPGRIALVGHSMGTYIATETARRDPRVAATVLFSSIDDQIRPGQPRNVLLFAASRDLETVRITFLKVLTSAGQAPLAAGAPFPGEDLRQGRAVTGVGVPGRNHITVLYEAAALRDMGRWLDLAFGPAGPEPRPDPRRAMALGWGLSLVTGALLVFLGLAAGLAGAVSGYPLAGTSAPHPYLWPLMYLLTGGAAVLAGAFFHPLSFLRLMVSDYLAFYLFVLFILLEGVRRLARPALFQQAHANLDVQRGWPSFLFGLLLFALFFALMGPALTAAFTNALPIGARLWRVAVLLPFLLPFSLLDENLRAAVHSRYGAAAAFGLAYLAKLAMAATWGISLKLPGSPFFLIIAMPVLLVFLATLDAVTTAVFTWRHESMSLGLFKALTLAWTLAVSFPLGSAF
ncbi:MAG: alpha/beta hydrolase [Bacillota bacterium]